MADDMEGGRQRLNPFAVALRNVPPDRLLAAFTQYNASLPGRLRYDRTALGRWLAGSVPTRREFVEGLADALDHPVLVQAWLEAGDRASEASRKRFVTGLSRLEPAELEIAARQIEAHVARLGPPAREHLGLRLELEDWPYDQRFFRARLSLNWEGRLPARAKVVLVTSLRGVDEAYDQPDCLFRDAVLIDEDTFADALGRQPITRQSLTYTPLVGTGGRPTTCAVVEVEPGLFEFDTPALDRARINLELSYPFPCGLQVFPILFRGYQVKGTAQVRLALRAERAHSPRSYAFPGHRHEWGTSAALDDLLIDLGHEDGVMGEYTGLVLSWQEDRPGGGPAGAAADGGDGHHGP